VSSRRVGLALLALAGVAVSGVGCVGGEPDIRITPDTDPEQTFQGRVQVEPQSLLIADALPGERTLGTVEVRNVGDFDLSLVSASLTRDADGVLVTDESTNADRTIGPDRAFEVIIRCTLPTRDSDDTDAPPADVSGTLRVRTLDPDTPTVDVDVRCTAASE